MTKLGVGAGVGAGPPERREHISEGHLSSHYTPILVASLQITSVHQKLFIKSKPQCLNHFEQNPFVCSMLLRLKSLAKQRYYQTC